MNISRIIIWTSTIIMILSILYFDLQNNAVKHREPTLIEPDIIHEDFERSQALYYLNHQRKASGLVALIKEPVLEQSAQNHAKYLIYNNKLSHDQLITDYEFTGITPVDRAIYAGYNANFVIENISTNNRNYKDSVDNLFSAIYHRFAFLDFKIDEIGIGILQNPDQRSKIAYVYNMGLSTINDLCNGKSFNGNGNYIYGVCADKTLKIKEGIFKSATSNVGLRSETVVVYPYEGQTDVPPAFFDEIPDPLPSHRVSGFPISISFNESYFKNLELLMFRLFDDKGNEVTNTLLYDHTSDPNGKFKRYEYALFPLERLEWNTQYNVKIVYSIDGDTKEKHWSFHTRSFKEKLHTVSSQNETFTISRNISSIFYLKPFSQNDILENILFPDYLHISLIDQNTLRLTATDASPDHVELKLGNHRLKLNIE